MSLSDYPTVEAAAEAFAGNWKRFDSFGWHDRPANADRCGIYYTSNRDSGCLDKSNEAAILAELEPFIGRTVFQEHHGHWAVGHVDGLCVVVYTKMGRITRAFRKLYELADRMSDYPVLDEDDFSRREWEEYESCWTDGGAASDMRHAVKDKFKLSQLAGYCLDEADGEQMREWYESLDPPGYYEADNSGVWPMIRSAVNKMRREDVARFLREIRARLRAAV